MPSVPDGDGQSETGAGIGESTKVKGMSMMGNGKWGAGGQCVRPPLQVSCQTAWWGVWHERVAAEDA